MFSSRALASTPQIFSFRSFVALCLVLCPHFAFAQVSGGGGTEEDPPPVWYRPGANESQARPDTFLCRTTFEDGTGPLYCAGDIGFDTATTMDLTEEPSLYTFVLDTHETIRLETLGVTDTRGEILDAGGVRMAMNENGGGNSNFRLTRTLGPGRYYVKVTGEEGRSTLLMKRSVPQHRDGRVSPAELTGDVGNHCGRAVGLEAFSTMASRFEAPGDVDVYAIDLEAASEVMINVTGGTHYELKAADCRTSLGLAASGFGATLAPLAKGTYFLYVSRSMATSDNYELSLELR